MNKENGDIMGCSVQEMVDALVVFKNTMKYFCETRSVERGVYDDLVKHMKDVEKMLRQIVVVETETSCLDQ